MRIPNWYRIENEGVRLYKAWNLHSSGLVEHGFSTRIGGSSAPPYESLDLSLNVGDDSAAVIANRRAFGAAIGIDAARIVVADQVHSDRVSVVTEEHTGSGAIDHASAIADTDALITNVPGVPLALHFADCVCIFLLDPDMRAIGAVHAGWRGTAARIAAKAVEAMAREFGTEPAALQAAVAPAIGRPCYEVGEETAREINRAFPGDERVLKPFSAGKWLADLKTANLITLRHCGVSEANIAFSDDCTSCNSAEFFSYRREGTTGRMGGWIALR